jgi:hypothetical protein
MIEGHLYKHDGDDYQYVTYGYTSDVPELGRRISFNGNREQLHLGEVEATDFLKASVSFRTETGWYMIRFYDSVA